MKKIKLNIEGMHCASCANNIERIVKKMPGVNSCNVNLLMKKGYIECSDEVKEGDIVNKIEKAGYEAKVEEESEMLEMSAEEHANMKEEHDHGKSPEEEEIASWKRKMSLAWILTIPIAILMLS